MEHDDVVRGSLRIDNAGVRGHWLSHDRRMKS